MDRLLIAYQHFVLEKYQQYNALFLRLPFFGVPEAGRDLPLFSEFCKTALEEKATPQHIIESFFNDFSEAEKIEKLFLFIQFIERQIVLFDALEDCAFELTHDMQGNGSLKYITSSTTVGDYKTRIVLTAHPTQFYTPYVLNIIHDLSDAIKKENIALAEKLLLQMGKTPFLSKTQPTPLDEADFLIRCMVDTFYPAIQSINYSLYQITGKFPEAIQLGFWPGGDRDGNPNVTAEITLKVAEHLKQQLLNCYRQDLSKISRRLTFHGTIEMIDEITNKMNVYQRPQNFLDDLLALRNHVLNEHEGLFVDLVDRLIAAVRSFGLHFATLDLRQDSRVHANFIARYIEGYANADPAEKIALLETAIKSDHFLIDENEDCIASLKTLPIIQANNGELSMDRYIISNTQSAENIIEVLLLNHWAKNDLDTLKLDIVPLFETIEDLAMSETIMASLYQNALYKKHLKQRNHQQTIMLGFSDGTKDGGYIAANWSIYLAKKKLTYLSKQHHIDVIFFDGRGGPPSRGGGKTYQYYRGVGDEITQQQIQLTIQGQTVSTNFGTISSAKYNILQLFTSGLDAKPQVSTFSKPQIILLQRLSDVSGEKYRELKNHPVFLQYLEHVTPLNYLGELNIASRPPRRGASDHLMLSDLRAIPFVTAWALMRQNVPGYFGVGTALNLMIKEGHEEDLKKCYQDSLFFKTLIDNAMQSVKKVCFPLTQYLADDPTYGPLWQLLYDEYILTKSLLLQLSGHQTLLEDDPISRLSIEGREEIVLPLQIIQQYALMNIKQQPENSAVMRKLILKSIAASINAARNSV